MRLIELSNIRARILVNGFEPRLAAQCELFGARDRYLVHIHQTPHFAALSGRITMEEYEGYIDLQHQEGQSAARFARLAANFSLEQLRQNRIRLEENSRGQLELLDGVHRLAAYSFLTGNESIPEKYLSIFPRPNNRLRTALKRTKGALSSEIDSGHGWERVTVFPPRGAETDVASVVVLGRISEQFASQLIVRGPVYIVSSQGANEGFLPPNPSVMLPDSDRPLVEILRPAHKIPVAEVNLLEGLRPGGGAALLVIPPGQEPSVDWVRLLGIVRNAKAKLALPIQYAEGSSSLGTAVAARNFRKIDLSFGAPWAVYVRSEDQNRSW